MQQDVRDFCPEQIPKTELRVHREMGSTTSVCVCVRWFLDKYPRQSGRPTATEAAASCCGGGCWQRSRRERRRRRIPSACHALQARQAFTSARDQPFQILRGAAEQGGVGDQISLGKQYRTAVATRVSPLSCVPAAGRPRVVLCGTAGGYYQLAAELEAQHHFDPTLLD